MLDQSEWFGEKGPRSTKYLLFLYSFFTLFMMGFFYNVSLKIDFWEIICDFVSFKQNISFQNQAVYFGFLVAVPYEKSIDTAEQVVNGITRVHICKGNQSHTHTH